MYSHIKNLHFFIKFAARELSLTTFPKINFVGSKENKLSTFGHSKNNSITVRITDRHPIDVMRTIAHELVHFKQNHLSVSGKNFREDQANAMAGRIMKKFADQYPNMFSLQSIPARLVETESAIPANSMGASSSTQGTGGIDTYDPLLGKIKKIIRRKRRIKEEIDRNEMLGDRVKEMSKGKSNTKVGKGQPNPLKNSLGNKNTNVRQNGLKVNDYDAESASLKLANNAIKIKHSVLLRKMSKQ